MNRSPGDLHTYDAAAATWAAQVTAATSYRAGSALRREGALVGRVPAGFELVVLVVLGCTG